MCGEKNLNKKMSVVEIPISDEIPEQDSPLRAIQESEIPEEKPEHAEAATEEIEKKDELPEEPPPKKTRGRPKGKAKPKPESPEIPERPKKPPKEKKREVAKPKKKRVVEFESSSGDELPEYVRKEMGPALERDLSVQMLKLLQNHESIRAAKKRRLYASWFAHH